MANSLKTNKPTLGYNSMKHLFDRQPKAVEIVSRAIPTRTKGNTIWMAEFDEKVFMWIENAKANPPHKKS